MPLIKSDIMCLHAANAIHNSTQCSTNHRGCQDVICRCVQTIQRVASPTHQSVGVHPCIKQQPAAANERDEQIHEATDSCKRIAMGTAGHALGECHCSVLF